MSGLKDTKIHEQRATIQRLEAELAEAQEFRRLVIRCIQGNSELHVKRVDGGVQVSYGTFRESRMEQGSTLLDALRKAVGS